MKLFFILLQMWPTIRDQILVTRTTWLLQEEKMKDLVLW